MTLLRAPGSQASGARRITPMGVFGAVRRPDGKIANVVPDEDRLRKALALPSSGSGLEALVTAAADILAEDRPATERPIAYLAVGFGPAPADHAIDWWKGDFDESEHPRWPAGAPDRQGGQFRDKDDGVGDDPVTRKLKPEDRARRLALRREARIVAATLLEVEAEAPLNFIPVAGEIADFKIMFDVAEAAAEFIKLSIDINAVINYIKSGARTLDELRVSQEDQSFTSYSGLKARFGSAVSGYQYHHIVEQSAIDGEAISARAVHNSENVVRIPALLHELINEVYSGRSAKNPSLTVRQWLRGQSYEEQRAFGIKVMRDLGIIR